MSSLSCFKVSRSNHSVMPSEHSTTVSVGYWLPGKPFGSTYTVLPSS
ncbi:hypothetical protein T4D_12722, partial [Trichinella pseudospiralis]